MGRVYIDARAVETGSCSYSLHPHDSCEHLCLELHRQCAWHRPCALNVLSLMTAAWATACHYHKPQPTTPPTSSPLCGDSAGRQRQPLPSDGLARSRVRAVLDLRLPLRPAGPDVPVCGEYTPWPLGNRPYSHAGLLSTPVCNKRRMHRSPAQLSVGPHLSVWPILASDWLRGVRLLRRS